MVIKTRLIQIGNSQGLRLPKAILNLAQLSPELEVEVREGALIVRGRRRPRAGWAEEAKALHARGEDQLLDPLTPTRFDRDEWQW